MGAPDASESTSAGAVLIPVKDFTRAKGRLTPALEPDARAELARRMATHVVTVQTTPVAIACDDDVVAEWARSLDAEVGQKIVLAPRLEVHDDGGDRLALL